MIVMILILIMLLIVTLIWSWKYIKFLYTWRVFWRIKLKPISKYIRKCKKNKKSDQLNIRHYMWTWISINSQFTINMLKKFQFSIVHHPHRVSELACHFLCSFQAETRIRGHKSNGEVKVDRTKECQETDSGQEESMPLNECWKATKLVGLLPHRYRPLIRSRNYAFENHSLKIGSPSPIWSEIIGKNMAQKQRTQCVIIGKGSYSTNAEYEFKHTYEDIIL